MLTADDAEVPQKMQNYSKHALPAKSQPNKLSLYCWNTYTTPILRFKLPPTTGVVGVCGLAVVGLMAHTCAPKSHNNMRNFPTVSSAGRWPPHPQEQGWIKIRKPPIIAVIKLGGHSHPQPDSDRNPLGTMRKTICINLARAT